MMNPLLHLHSTHSFVAIPFVLFKCWTLEGDTRLMVTNLIIEPTLTRLRTTHLDACYYNLTYFAAGDLRIILHLHYIVINIILSKYIYSQFFVCTDQWLLMPAPTLEDFLAQRVSTL